MPSHLAKLPSVQETITHCLMQNLRAIHIRNGGRACELMRSGACFTEYAGLSRGVVVVLKTTARMTADKENVDLLRSLLCLGERLRRSPCLAEADPTSIGGQSSARLRVQGYGEQMR